jgi:hypothetical protein
VNVVGQHFDHLTFIDATVAASLDHQFMLRLHRRQADYSLLPLGKPCLGDGVGGADLEAKFAREATVLVTANAMRLLGWRPNAFGPLVPLNRIRSALADVRAFA